MTRQPAGKSRRQFLHTLTAASAIPPIASTRLADEVFQITREKPIATRPVGPNDTIRLATIGTGIIGHIDTDTALQVPGVELVAAADIYEGRRTRVNEKYGPHIATTVDYREILDRDDIDAVLICVPDHWHAVMAIDAMKAGKAVYCEKPMVRTLAEGPSVIEVAEQTGAVFQVGSQYASSLVHDKARELIAAGQIGVLNAIEVRMNRNSSLGACQYSIPTDATPQTVDWDRFLGTAPKRDFDPVRAFRWRNYWDYGTAIGGDLYVHLFTGIHHATRALGPTRIAAMGGLRFWDDGRDVYDVLFGLFDYPRTDDHPAFNVALQTNLADGGGEDTYYRFVGSEGTITAGWSDLTLQRVGMIPPSESAVLQGYNSVVTFSEAQQKAYAEKFRAERQASPPAALAHPGTTRYVAPDGYDSRLDHLAYFFNSVRSGAPVYENAVFGYRAAAPALLCNESYRQGRILEWDPVAMTTPAGSA